MSDDTHDRYAEPSPDHESESPDADAEDRTPGDAAGVPVASEDALDASSETFRPVGE